MISTRNKNPRSSSQNRPPSRKRLIVVIAIVLLVAALIAGAWSIYSREQNNRAETAVGSSNTGTINMDPPTEEEKQAGDEQKDKIVYEQQNPPKATDTASIVIVDASQYNSTVEVRAFVSNRIDQDGTCTVTFTKGSATVTRTRTATPDASTSQCGLFSIPVSDFSEKGTWNLDVSYASGSAKGEAKTEVTLR